MGIFQPIWMTNKIDKRNKAVEYVKSISDQETLISIINRAPFDSVREAAVNNLENETMLLNLVVNDRSLMIREAALSRLKHPQNIATVIKDCVDKKVRSEAITILSDKNTLTDLITNIHDEEILRELVFRIENLFNAEDAKEMYLKALKETRWPQVRKNSLWALRNSNLTKEDALSLTEYTENSIYTFNATWLLINNCPDWKNALTLKCIKEIGIILKSSRSSYYDKLSAEELLKFIFDEGLFKEQIRKYNGTILSEEYISPLTDDDNYGGRYGETRRFYVF